MKVFTSDLAIKRELRRRGWLDAVLALKDQRNDWFIQDGNDFLVCLDHELYWYRVEAKDNPASLYTFKLLLGGLANLSRANRQGGTLRATKKPGA